MRPSTRVASAAACRAAGPQSRWWNQRHPSSGGTARTLRRPRTGRSRSPRFQASALTHSAVAAAPCRSSSPPGSPSAGAMQMTASLSPPSERMVCRHAPRLGHRGVDHASPIRLDRAVEVVLLHVSASPRSPVGPDRSAPKAAPASAASHPVPSCATRFSVPAAPPSVPPPLGQKLIEHRSWSTRKVRERVRVHPHPATDPLIRPMVSAQPIERPRAPHSSIVTSIHKAAGSWGPSPRVPDALRQP